MNGYVRVNLDLPPDAAETLIRLSKERNVARTTAALERGVARAEKALARAKARFAKVL